MLRRRQIAVDEQFARSIHLMTGALGVATAAGGTVVLIRPMIPVDDGGGLYDAGGGEDGGGTDDTGGLYGGGGVYDDGGTGTVVTGKCPDGGREIRPGRKRYLNRHSVNLASSSDDTRRVLTILSLLTMTLSYGWIVVPAGRTSLTAP